MKKIVFVMPKLGGGGAERVVSTIIRHINKKKFDCHLILFNREGDYQSDIPKSINIEVIKNKNILFFAYELIKKIRKIDPDIVFSSMRSVSALLSVLKLFLPSKLKFVFRENNTPSVSIKESRFPFIWKVIYKTLFKNADTIICQSNYMVNDFKNEFNYSGQNLVRIYNPVDIDMIKKKSENGTSPFSKIPGNNVVVVGKMTKQKGIDILLKSFAKYDERNKDTHLWLLGEGEKISEYQALSNNLGISDRVHFVGRQKNPFIWMRHADLFILPSRYEGLPNVLLEAICLGCPVVTTNHPGGTNEIMEIIDATDRIVELNWDDKWFTDMIVDEEKFKRYFDVFNVITLYEDVFEDT